MRKHLLWVLLLALGCSTGPKPIAYGEVGCHSCSMTVVDRQHAAQLITDKGKVYVFDAIECLVNVLQSENAPAVGQLWVNDYNRPADLIDARSATFLISPAIPSPMGAYLSAFASTEEAEQAQQDHGGQLYDWEALQAYFRKPGNHAQYNH